MRVSRPVLRGPAGAIPVGYSPTDTAGQDLSRRPQTSSGGRMRLFTPASCGRS